MIEFRDTFEVPLHSRVTKESRIETVSYRNAILKFIKPIVFRVVITIVERVDLVSLNRLRR